MNSELKARLARPGPVRDADPPPSFSGDPLSLVLRIEYPWDTGVRVANRLRAAGLTLGEAHAAINRLAARQTTTVEIAGGADISGLITDLAALGVAATGADLAAHPAASMTA